MTTTKSVRWWPAVAIVLLWLLALGLETFTGDRSGQDHIMARLALSFVAGFLLFLWFLFFSRLPWRRRLLGLAGLGGIGVLLAFLVEIRGVSGDLLPVLAWRWTPKPGAAAPAPVPPPIVDPAPVPVAGPTPELVAPASAPETPAVPASEPVPEPAVVAAPAPAEPTRETLPGATDWPQFLGPRRDGSVPGVALAREWTTRAPREVWRRPIGAGWAGFAVVSGRIFTLEQEGGDEVVSAAELATGKPLWRHADPARYESTIGGVGPRSVPAVVDGRVFALGATGRLRALDAESGRLLWLRDLLADGGGPNPEWGRSVSPLVVDRLVVVGAGGADGHSVLAYDAATGDLRWHGGDDGPSFSSPIVAELAGVRQVVNFNSNSLTGHALDDGRVLWRYPWPREQPNVSTPLVLGANRLFASSGYGIGGKLLEFAVDPDGKLEPRLVWESPRLKAKFTNVVHHDDRLYGLDDGTLVCLDPTTGERCWKEGRYGHGQVILAGKLLLVLAEDGELVLVDPVPEGLKVLGSYPLFAGKTWNPPALAGRYLLARTDQEAVLLELP